MLCYEMLCVLLLCWPESNRYDDGTVTAAVFYYNDYSL